MYKSNCAQAWMGMEDEGQWETYMDQQSGATEPLCIVKALDEEYEWMVCDTTYSFVIF